MKEMCTLEVAYRKEEDSRLVKKVSSAVISETEEGDTMKVDKKWDE